MTLCAQLGGKNPTIVDKDCDFDASARRILWAKSANAGQSCTAPDYIMVVGREAHDKLITALQKASVVSRALSQPLAADT